MLALKEVFSIIFIVWNRRPYRCNKVKSFWIIAHEDLLGDHGVVYIICDDTISAEHEMSIEDGVLCGFGDIWVLQELPKGFHNLIFFMRREIIYRAVSRIVANKRHADTVFSVCEREASNLLVHLCCPSAYFKVVRGGELFGCVFG